MSFVQDYLLATSHNESPLSYHKWCCLSALSVLVGRRFWFKLGPFTYYPQFYTILVGDPGVKKSAAMEVAKEVIRNVGGFPIAATSTTKEAITKMMGHDKFPGKKFFKNPEGLAEEYNQLAIFATEFTTFLGVNPIGMIDFLTNIYTEKVYDEKYKNTGESNFTGPYITMLACMTPETTKGFLKLNILTGGFSRRTMFVWGSHGRPISRPGNSPEQQEALKRCVEWGKAVQVHNGEFKFSTEAWEWWDKWYNENYSLVKDKPHNTQAYFLTKHEFLIKTVMLLALSEDIECRTITPEHFIFVNERFFAPAEEVLPRVFEGAGINPNANAVNQICRMLEATDRPMGKKYLQAMFFDNVTSVRELDDSINHLVNVGRLSSRTVQANGQILGEVIGVPEVLRRYSDVDLVPFLQRAVPPPLAEDKGQSS